MDEVPEWKVVLCPACGWPQVCRKRKIIVCKYCRKRAALRRQAVWKVKLLFCENEVDAVAKCRCWLDQLGLFEPQMVFTPANEISKQ